MNEEITNGYKKTKVGIIPNNWNITRLSEIADIRDGTHDSPKYHSEGVPFITSKNLNSNGLDLANVNFISEEDHINFSKRSKVENGDILFGMIGTIGNPVIVNTPFEISIKNVALIKFNNDLLFNVYMKYLLDSYFIYKQFQRLSDGGVQKFIGLGTIRKLEIPVPTISEQRKIATNLSSVDYVIEKTQAIIEQIEKVKKGLMQQLLTKGIGHTKFKKTEIGEIPEEWEVKTFNELLGDQVIVGIQDGNHGGAHPKASDYVETGIPFVMANSLANGTVDLKNCHFIRKEQADKLRIGFAKTGDVLLSHKGTIGRTAIVPEVENYVMLTPQVTYYRIGRADKLINHFLKLYFDSGRFQAILESLSAQSTRSYIGITNQKKLFMAIPPISEQQQIVNIIESIDKKILNENQKLFKLHTVKTGLMQVLLTGKVRVKVDEEEVTTS